MPSLSPGEASPTDFAEIYPGAPTESLQAITTYTFRWKRYIVYISGKQLNILRSATVLVQAITFEEDLIAVSAEGGDNGKIAVATARDVWILQPQTNSWNHVTWRKGLLLKREDAGDKARSICWGNDGELLIGGSRQMSLFSTLPTSRASSPTSTPRPQLDVEERHTLWSKDLASPIQTAAFSPSASLIASCGHPDRLAKIWRRLSFEEGLFDYAYLPHPGPVTHLEWRAPDPPRLEDDTSDDQRAKAYNRQEDEQEVLYTFCTDGCLRVWKTGGHHDLDILALHTTVDLVSAIPQSPVLASNGSSNLAKPARYAFILPSGALVSSIASALSKHSVGKLSHSAEHLKEVSSKHPDVVITLDGHGRMSAWGLQSVGHKRRPSTPSGNAKQAYHITHAEDLELEIQPGANARFLTWFEGDSMNVLIHTFGEHSAVHWWAGSVESFFSPAAAGKDRLSQAAYWSGGAEIMTRLIDHNATVVSAAEDIASRLEDLRIESPRLSEASDLTAAFVSSIGRELTIVDLHEGYVEHRQQVTGTVKSLRLSTDAQSSLLAVAYAECVDILVRGRYQVSDKPEGLIWRHLKRISISGMGLEIESIAWKGNGKLALRAGNGVFLDSAMIQATALPRDVGAQLQSQDGESVALKTVAQALERPLPLWHPDALQHLCLHGTLQAAFRVLTSLEQKLKFYTEGDALSPILDLDPRELTTGNTGQHHVLDQDTVESLRAQLENVELPLISSEEQHRFEIAIDTAVFLQEHVGSLDANALRYLFTWQLSMKLQKPENEPLVNGDCAQVPAAPAMHWREIAFAYHSETQQPLLEILNTHYGKSLNWAAVRNLGIPAWIRTIQAAQSEGSDLASLEQIFEVLAQSAYRSSSPPDPSRAALYFLALRKKPTLLALWRVAVGNREQKSTMNFLKRDFSVEDNKTAARKNAYALMGKRRFEYAAAFFLLADDAASAIRILAGQCEDLLLAIAVARVYCGDGSPVLRAFVSERVIPAAKQSGDRWLLSWAHETIGDRALGAQALVAPFSRMSEPGSDATDQVPRRWQQDDPMTVQLYEHLRATISKPGRTKGTISLGAEGDEYSAVLRFARILRRMGLWILALDLVSKWTFSKPAATDASAANGSPTAAAKGAPSMLDGFEESAAPAPANGEPKSMLDDFASPSPAAQPPAAKSMLDDFETLAPTPAVDQAKLDREAKAAELMAKLKAKKAGAASGAGADGEKLNEPTEFKEPEASSILDSFGF